MKEVHHNNICTFFGACIEKDKIVLVYEHCSRGNLQVKYRLRHIIHSEQTVVQWVSGSMVKWVNKCEWVTWVSTANN